LRLRKIDILFESRLTFLHHHHREKILSSILSNPFTSIRRCSDWINESKGLACVNALFFTSLGAEKEGH
jgi:hypothetical protein